MVVHERTRGEKTMQHISPLPIGYGVLPERGGLLDQNHRLMEFFDEFMSGERRAFQE